MVGVWNGAGRTEWTNIAKETWQILLVVQWNSLVVQGSPGQFPTPPPRPLAGWTQVPGTCGFDSWECFWEHCGNLRFMPCKEIGFHEKFLGIFLSAVWSQVNKFWFPGTFCNVPRSFFKNSQERFLGSFFHVPRWPYSRRTVHGTCLSKKYELAIMNEYGVWKSSAMVCHWWWSFQTMKDQAPTLLKKIRNKATMPMHWYSCKRIRHRMGTGVERLKEIDAANLNFIACFFLCVFFFP